MHSPEENRKNDSLKKPLITVQIAQFPTVTRKIGGEGGGDGYVT